MAVFAQLHHGIAVGPSHDLVGQFSHGVLNLWVLETPAHEPFHREKGVLRVGYSLTLGDLAYIALPSLDVQSYNGRSYPAAFSVLHDYGFTSFDDCRYRVCGPEVDSQNFSHLVSPNYSPAGDYIDIVESGLVGAM